MFKKLALGAVGLIVIAVAVVLVLGATKPDTFRVVRSITIAAPPEKIYPLISDFHRWTAWSPYEHRDPAMKRSFAGADSGAGAIYAWSGNSEIGEGSMEIVEAVPSTKILLKLDFTRPFEAHNNVTFTLAPKGPATEVIWDMQGPNPYFSKVIHVLVNMDRMVGGDFETGLASLKATAEK